MTTTSLKPVQAAEPRSSAGGAPIAAWTPRAVLAMVGLCLLATIARVATTRGLWVDEAISVSQARMGFSDMIADVAGTDVHPPLYHSLLWLTVRLFGISEFALRLPSLVAGVALVPALFWAGRVCYSRRTGWVAAALATFAPFLVWYSQEVRMYSLFMLLSVLAIGAQVNCVRRGMTRDWLFYGVTTALLFCTQYFAVLPILVQQLAFGWVFWTRRRDMRRLRTLARGWAISASVAILIIAPVIPVLLEQLDAYANRGGAGLVPGQAGAASSALQSNSLSIYSIGANLTWALLGYHADPMMVLLVALWPFGMLLAFLMLGRGRSGTSVLLLMIVLVPLGALFMLGAIRRDVFELRYFAGAVPALLLLLARVITATTVRLRVTAFVSVVVALLMLVALVDQQTNGSNPRRYDFDTAFAAIGAEEEPGDIVLYAPTYLAEVFEYYVPQFSARPAGSPVPAGRTVWLLATDSIVNTPDKAAALGGQLAKLEADHVMVEEFTKPNIHVWKLAPR